jgi:DNA transformation protein
MNEFVDYLKEVFEEFGPVQARRMFGGHGLFYDGLMFGLVADDTLYLKGDKESAPHFEERRLPRFEYAKANKTVKLSYYMAPEEIFDDPGEAAIWAQRAFEAALRAHRKPRRK